MEMKRFGSYRTTILSISVRFVNDRNKVFTDDTDYTDENRKVCVTYLCAITEVPNHRKFQHRLRDPGSRATTDSARQGFGKRNRDSAKRITVSTRCGRSRRHARSKPRENLKDLDRLKRLDRTLPFKWLLKIFSRVACVFKTQHPSAFDTRHDLKHVMPVSNLL